MEEVKKIFSANLKKLRKEKNYTQKSLAEKLMYTEKTVAKWESGKCIPPAETLLSIASILEISIDTFFHSNKEDYYLGIDGGGTKTELALADKNGGILSRLIAGPSNPVDIGIEKSQEVLQNSIQELVKNIPFSSVKMFAGIAGGTAGNNQHILKMFFSNFGFKSFSNGNDIDNLLYSGLDGKDGLAMILGTGIALYKVKEGKIEKMGGLGYLFDEGGSGYNLGRDVIYAYYSSKEGYGEETILTEMIDESIDMDSAELLTLLYKKGKRYIASFSDYLFKGVEKGDKVCKEILRRNMKIAASLIESGAKDFRGRVKAVVSGGISKNVYAIEELKKNIIHKEKIELFILDKSPVEGAIKLAMLL